MSAAQVVVARNIKYSVKVTSGENAGKIYHFDKSVVTIGRGPENDLVFASDAKISRVHAEFRVQMGQLSIHNVSPKNYILIDGEELIEKTLFSEHLIQVGDTVLAVELDAQSKGKSTASPVALVNPNSNSAELAGVNNSAVNSFSPLQPIANRPIVSSGLPPSMSVNKPISKPQNVVTQQTQFPSPTAVSAMNTASNMSSSQAMTKPPAMNPVRMVIALLLIGGVGWYFLGNNIKSKNKFKIRSESDVQKAIDESTQVISDIKAQKEKKGQDSIQYQKAQEYYIAGFRDYMKGQYARAMQSFQASLSFYPNHELARKYYSQAQRKFEQQVDQSMNLGRKYYQKQNYELCKSSYANVMIMLKDSSKLKYREAKQYYDECSLKDAEKF